VRPCPADIEVTGRQRFDRDVERWDRIYSGTGPALVRVWNRATRANVRQRFDRSFELAGPLNGKTVLDLGAGTGRYVTHALDHGARHAVAVDSSPAMVAHLAAMRDERGYGSKMEVLQADITELELSRSFDLVIVNGVLDYAADPGGVVRTAWHLCDGQLVMTAPDRWALRAPIRRSYWKARGLRTCYFRRGELVALLEAAGARPSTIERIGPVFLVAAAARSRS